MSKVCYNLRVAELALSTHGNHSTGHMNILDGFKTCRKGLHRYPKEKTRCPECHKIANQKWAKTNKIKRRGHQEKYRKAYPERIRKSREKYKENHPNGFKKARKRWSEKNQLKEKACQKQWRQLNRGLINGWLAKRRAVKKQAMPAWANKINIEKIYKKAHELTERTGVPHEVDHIYPLQSKYMCGLHVETNLQILTKKENRVKGNRTWPGQLDCQKD
jgi:hypothetical protein